MRMMLQHDCADEASQAPRERGAERPLQAEVWVISRQTRTCGRGRGSPHPHLGSPAPLHTGSPNQCTHKHAEESVRTHVETCTGATQRGEKKKKKKSWLLLRG